MKAEQMRKLMLNKTKTLTIRISPELLGLLDKTLGKDTDYQSRNELIEVLILRYLESKGML